MRNKLGIWVLCSFIRYNQLFLPFSGILKFISILQEHHRYKNIATEEFEEEISDIFASYSRAIKSSEDSINNDYQVIDWSLETYDIRLPFNLLGQKRQQTGFV